MKRSVLVTALVTALALAGCGSSSSQTASTAGTADRSGGPRPPVAAQRHHVVTSPNGDREDPYYWLRDDTRKNPDVIGYLNAENAYTASVLGPPKSLQDTLFAQMKSRMREDDTGVRVFDDGYGYYTRFSAGQEHPVVVRRKGTMDAPEELVLDGNE